jgi:hypothetical protein
MLAAVVGPAAGTLVMAAVFLLQCLWRPARARGGPRPRLRGRLYPRSLLLSRGRVCADRPTAALLDAHGL